VAGRDGRVSVRGWWIVDGSAVDATVKPRGDMPAPQMRRCHLREGQGVFTSLRGPFCGRVQKATDACSGATSRKRDRRPSGGLQGSRALRPRGLSRSPRFLPTAFRSFGERLADHRTALSASKMRHVRHTVFSVRCSRSRKTGSSLWRGS
jgi:hypothetical protein